MDESRKQFEQAYEQLRKDGQTINLWDVWSMAWEKSRAAIEIELPTELQLKKYACSDCISVTLDEVEKAIRAAGIKVKE